jgi:hypothetical protein
MESVETIALGPQTLRIPTPAFPPGAAHYHQQTSIGLPVLAPQGSIAAAYNATPPAATAYRVWPCARELAEWLHQSEHAPSIDGGCVLELGAGCGVAGLAAWLRGAARVYLSELPENVPRLERIVALNDAASAVSVVSLDWTAPLPPALVGIDVSLILAADCVFWPHLFGPLLSTVDAIHGNARRRGAPTPRTILAMTDRLGRAREFAVAAQTAGWTLQRLPPHASARPPPPQSLESMRREACELYELIHTDL